jgi:hypothetical protein
VQGFLVRVYIDRCRPRQDVSSLFGRCGRQGLCLGRISNDQRIGSASGGHSIVPSSVFFPLFAAALRVTQIGRGVFEHARITLVIIHRHVRVLCSLCFSFYKSLSSILFVCDSELIRIASKVFSSSLESITIPRHVQFINGSAFATISKILQSMSRKG